MAEKPTYEELEQRIQKLERFEFKYNIENTAARESREQYISLLKDLPAGFALHEIILNAHGNPCDYRFLDINPAFEQITGLKAEEIVGKTLLQVLPDSESFWIETYGKVATTGKSMRFEQYSKELGKYYHVTSYAPKPGQFIAIFLDITEHKQKEEIIQQKNEFLNLILDSLSHPFCVINLADYTVTLANSAARSASLPGVSKCYALSHMRNTPCESPEHDCPIEIIKKTKKPVTLEHIHYDKDGDLKNIEVNAFPVLDRERNITQIIEYLVNITEHKKRDDNLRITQFSVDRAAEPVAWIEQNGRFLYVNDAYCRLFNYSRDEILSMGIYDQDPSISEKDWPEYFGKIKQQKASFFETSRHSKNGVLIPVKIHASYLAFEGRELVISYCRDIRKQKEYEKKLQRNLKRLTALRTIDMAITSSFDMRVTFHIFLEQVSANLNVDAVQILLFNAYTYKLEYTASRGFRTDALRYTDLSIGEGYAGRAFKERQTICIPDLKKESRSLLFKQSPLLKNENFVSYYGVPLISKGHVKGVFELFNRTPLEPDQDWLDFLESLAGQAAIAIDNALLFNDLEKSNLDLIMAYDSTIEGWSRALDLRDKETEGHSQRVTEMTLQIARKMGMKDSDLVHVRRGALLHDIGKMGIPDHILLKPGPLNDEEWEIMRKHPEYAYELLSHISYLKPALDIPYCHHEKWDGTGYPRGLKGKQIPQEARIFAIVDVWDALCSDRPYRFAWPPEKASKHIQELAGKHFDPKVVEVFIEFLMDRNRD